VSFYNNSFLAEAETKYKAEAKTKAEN